MQDSHPTTTSRRRVLRSAGAALTAAAAGSAGCLSSLPPLGSQIEFGRVDVPDAPFSPDYRKYTPSPTVFGHDFYHGAPVAIVPSAFADDRVARRNSIGRSIVMSATEYYGRPFEDYEMAVNLGAASVLTGPIQRSNVAAFLADIAEETRAAVAAQAAETTDGGGSANAITGLERALGAVVEAARRATERADAGDRADANRQLRVVADRLQRVATRLDEASDDLSDPLSRAARKRLEQANRRTEQARSADKL